MSHIYERKPCLPGVEDPTLCMTHCCDVDFCQRAGREILTGEGWPIKHRPRGTDNDGTA